MIDKIKQIENSAKEKISAAKSSNEIEELRVAFLGKKGKVVEILKNLKNVEADKRKEVASFANNVKNKIEEEIENKKESIKEKEYNDKINSAKKIDLSMII